MFRVARATQPRAAARCTMARRRARAPLKPGRHANGRDWFRTAQDPQARHAVRCRAGLRLRGPDQLGAVDSVDLRYPDHRGDEPRVRDTEIRDRAVSDIGDVSDCAEPDFDGSAATVVYAFHLRPPV